MRCCWFLLLCSCVAHGDELLERLNRPFTVNAATPAPLRARATTSPDGLTLEFQPGGPTLQLTSDRAVLNGTLPGRRTRSQYYYHYVFHDSGRDWMYTFVLRQHDVALQIDSRVPGKNWMPEATWFLHP